MNYLGIKNEDVVRRVLWEEYNGKVIVDDAPKWREN
jgi:hypothetical protein